MFCSLRRFFIVFVGQVALGDHSRFTRQVAPRDHSSAYRTGAECYVSLHVEDCITVQVDAQSGNYLYYRFLVDVLLDLSRKTQGHPAGSTGKDSQIGRENHHEYKVQ